MSLISPAFAASGAAGGFDVASFLPMIVIFALFWFLLVRPQQKRAKEVKLMLSALGKGDEVITQGGLMGRIVKLNEQMVSLEIAAGVEVQLQRGAITGKLEKGTIKSL
jgi:preprotein translocase subunit YajC